jgi:alanine racemase
VATVHAVAEQIGTRRPEGGAWAEVRLDALRQNVRTIGAHIGPKVSLMAVVKADAYGHGATAAARAFVEAGAAMLGVARLDEALALRAMGLEAPIVILGATDPDEARFARGQDIAMMIADTTWLDAYEHTHARTGPPLKVHLMVDTGMGRIGVRPDQCLAVARWAMGMPGVQLDGVATHFATADEPDLGHTESQLTQFQSVLARLLRHGIRARWVHAANSAGALRVSRSHFNLVRCGISLYGLRPSPDMALSVPLCPALRVSSRVTAVRDVPAGATVGYGRRFTAPEPMRTATIAIGYGDGYLRALSGCGQIGLRGRWLTVLGRVSMDQIVVDARPAPDIRAGDIVTVYSDVASEPNSVENTARLLDTIPYEVTCLLTPRVRRLHLAE